MRLDGPVTREFEENMQVAANRQSEIVLAAITAMGESLALAEAKIAGGHPLDLTGLDLEISRLCAASRAAPPAMIPAIRRGLEALLAQTERLRAGLPVPDPKGPPP
ncbi:MAG: hypothetical protein RL312_842 [Pseudomonadota bacterium]